MEKGVLPRGRWAAENSELISVSRAEEWVLCGLARSPASCFSRPGLARGCQEWPKVEGQEVPFYFLALKIVGELSDAQDGDTDGHQRLGAAALTKPLPVLPSPLLAFGEESCR